LKHTKFKNNFATGKYDYFQQEIQEQKGKNEHNKLENIETRWKLNKLMTINAIINFSVISCINEETVKVICNHNFQKLYKKLKKWIFWNPNHDYLELKTKFRTKIPKDVRYEEQERNHITFEPKCEPFKQKLHKS
jgi:hypothetical protein